jgi:hypothetical protein
MSQKFKSQIDAEQGIKISNELYDGSAEAGSSGQVLSSTGTGTQWIDSNSETAERIEVTVKNVSGGSLAKGVVVHAAPTATPPSGNVIEVIEADANDAAKMPAIGVLNETIADEAEGAAVMFGAVSGIDTSSFTIGDELYVSETAGEFTATKPTAFNSQVQKIAVVIKSHASNGLIKVFGAGRANDVPNRVDRDMNFTDDSELTFGDSSDLKIYHTTNNLVRINSGDLIFNSFVTDGDIKFQLDNGSGSLTEYMRLDGGTKNIVFSKPISGTTASFSGLVTGIAPTSDLNFATKKYVDDNIPTITTPTLSAVLGAGNTSGSNDLLIADDQKLLLGDDSDFEIFKWSAGDNFIRSNTGHLYLQIEEDDHDMYFQGDDGSGGKTTYFFMDGSEKRTKFLQNLEIVDDNQLILGSNDNSYLKWDSTASQLFISGESKFLNDLYVVGDIIGNLTGNVTGGTISGTTGTFTSSVSVVGIFTVNEGQVWDATTQGKGKGSIHIDPDEDTADSGGAITFGASDSGAGNNAQAGIYIRSDGTYGTKMYLSTTDSYATGSKTAMTIDHYGNVVINRGSLTGNSATLSGQLFLDRIETETGNYAGFRFKATDDTLKFKGWAYASADNNLYVYNYNTGNEVLRIDNNDITYIQDKLKVGPVGTAPTFNVENVASGSNRYYVESTNNDTAGIYMVNKDAGTMTSNGTIRVNNAGYMQFITGTTSQSISADIGPAGVLSTFLSTSSQDSIRFYNSDGNYSYIRTTAASNANNVWFDGHLGSTMWHAWDNPGSLRTADVYTTHYFGVGRGTTNESVEINRGTIIQNNSAGTAINKFNVSGVSYINSGNIGIGTIEPDRQLEIYGTNDGYMKFDGGRTDNHGFTIGSDAYGFVVYDDTLSAYRLIIDQDTGNIALGTSSSTIISGGKLVTHLGTNRNIAHNTTTINSTVVPRISSFNDAVTTTEPLAINGSPIYMTSGDVRITTSSRQTTAPLSIRNNGSNIEFGHNNTSSGYFGTVGSMYNNGTPFISFSCSSDSTIGGNNFRTYGFKGNVIHGETNGDLKFSQATTATSASQSLTTRMVLKSDGNLYTTGFIGVGDTTAPQGKIDFGTAVNTDLFLYNSASNDRYGFDMRQYDSGPYGTNIFSGNGGVIRFRTGSGGTKATRMLIAADGTVTMYGLLNVNDLGITNNLSVGNSARFEGTTNAITIGDGFGYGGSATICRKDDSIYLQYNNGQTATNVFFGGGGTATTIHDYQNSDYHFGSGSDSYFTEKLGVGVTSPAAKVDIHLSDSNGVYGRGSDGNLNLNNTNTANTEGGWMSISGYMGNTTGPSYEMGAISGGKTSAAGNNNYGGYLTLWTTSGGSNGVGEANSGMYERVRVTQSGATGIRTGSNVKTTFHVDSYGLANTSFGSNNIGTMFLSDGNYSASGRTPCIDFGSMNYSVPKAKIGVTITSSGSTMKFGTSNNYSVGVTNQAMTINQNGNVSINLTDTSYKFQVSGESQIAGINFEVGSYPGIRFRENDGGTNRWKWGKEPTTNQLYLYDYGANTSILQFVQNGNIYFNPTGNVSIGIAQGGANSYKFSVKGGSADLNGVRAGQDWHIPNRAGIRLDSKGTSYPSDILFGHTAAANQSSWTGVYWAFSSRGTSSTIDNSFYIYRGGGQPSPYNSEAVLLTYTPQMQVGINKDSGISYTLDVTGTIRATSDVIAFSDIRVKENIITIDNALNKITKLRGVTYTRKDIDDKSTKIGVIAQEVLEVLPEVVEKDDEGMYSVAYGNMAGVFIEAIKELKAEVDSLKEEIKQLKK